MESEIESPATDGRSSIRVQAVLALLRGELATQVSAQFAICRSDLYKFRKRALDAMRDALRDEKKGPTAEVISWLQEYAPLWSRMCELHLECSPYSLILASLP